MSPDPVKPDHCVPSNDEAEIVEENARKDDNFYSPYNRDFYSRHSYAALDPARRQIRLLRIDVPEHGPVRC